MSKAATAQKADESGRVRGQKVRWVGVGVGVGVGEIETVAGFARLLNYVESVVLDLLSACALISNP